MAKVIKKAQSGFAADLLKKKAASDTTKMYNREEFINIINKGLKTPSVKPGKGTTSYKYISRSGDTTAMGKKDFEKTFAKQKSGGKTPKDKNWIQKAVNPKHKGYCTPMTKATCTPKRKALAKTFKAMGRARKGK
jgi:hypothetical protein